MNNITLVDEIKKELEACDKEMNICKAYIVQYDERHSCYAEKKKMLENLLSIAMNEQEKTNKPTTARKTAKREENMISVKNLATKMHATTPAIAEICTELGYNESVAENNYMLTKEQADAIAKRFTEINEQTGR